MEINESRQQKNNQQGFSAGGMRVTTAVFHHQRGGTVIEDLNTSDECPCLKSLRDLWVCFFFDFLMFSGGCLPHFLPGHLPVRLHPTCTCGY